MTTLSSITRQPALVRWLTWAGASALGVVVCMFVALPAAYGLAEAVEPSLGSAAGSAIIGAVFGAGLGAGLGAPQALLLGQRNGGVAWAAASILGGAVGGAAFGPIQAVFGWDSTPAMVLAGLAMGAGIGIGQWLALRRRVDGAGWWAPAAAASVFAALAVALPLGGEGRELLAFSACGIVAGALTGAAMLRLPRPPGA